MKKFIKNFKVVIVSTICFYLAYITGTGEILNYVPFVIKLNLILYYFSFFYSINVRILF